MGKRLEMITQALLQLNNAGLLTDEELVWKLKQAYVRETQGGVEQNADEGGFEAELSEIPAEMPRVRARVLPIDNKARIEALRKGLR